jgi:L-aminopeptidase/D-esterase-like protein
MSEIDRRGFSVALAAGVAATWPARARAGDGGASRGGAPLAPGGGLTDVPGLRVGHFTDPRRPTGCTVVLAEQGAVCGADVRGGAPGTRETDLLDPVNSVQEL